MLLATYALLTLRIEQKQERASIQHLQDCLAQPPSYKQFDGEALAARSEELIPLRRVPASAPDRSRLVPAPRTTSSEASGSPRRREHLCRMGREILPRIRWFLRPGARLGEQHIAGAYAPVQAYCQIVAALRRRWLFPVRATNARPRPRNKPGSIFRCDLKYSCHKRGVF